MRRVSIEETREEGELLLLSRFIVVSVGRPLLVVEVQRRLAAMQSEDAQCRVSSTCAVLDSFHVYYRVIAFPRDLNLQLSF